MTSKDLKPILRKVGLVIGLGLAIYVGLGIAAIVLYATGAFN